MNDLHLPDGYRARSLTPGDVQPVTDLVAATELEVDGEVEIDVSDVQGDWNRPSFDLPTMAVGIEHDGRLVAFAEHFRGRAEVEVHPDHRERGLGTALLRWTWQAAEREGRDLVGQTVSDAHLPAGTLLRAHGHEARWTSWILRIDLADDPGHPRTPEGFSIRDWEPGADDRAIFDVIETAFDEWPDREGHPFEDWAASFLRHSAVSPATTPLVVRDGRVVGVAMGMDYGATFDEGWVQQLAVAKEHRGLGLGRALLTESFRRFREQGKRQAGLSTDSRTGALALYQHVGMRVDRSYTHWSRALRGD